jgi:hypothetical protein
MATSPVTAFNLKQPCGACPFRTDQHAFLDPERAREIADHLLAGDSFHCHKTLDYSSEDGSGETTSKSMHCAGAMIVLEHEERPNQIMRIAERLGFYDHTKLNMDSPVPHSMDEWVARHEGGRV